MPIDPAALAQNLSSLATVDPQPGTSNAADRQRGQALLRVDGARLMLADERGQLRWATDSDQEAQVIEEGQGG